MSTYATINDDGTLTHKDKMSRKYTMVSVLNTVLLSVLIVLLSFVLSTVVHTENMVTLMADANNNNTNNDVAITRFAVSYMTPRQTQDFRGTCWDFATMHLLEQSYRDWGVKKGWLQEDEYVQFSEQAYGAFVLEQCQEQPEFCLIPGDEVWKNSTEGGEIYLLYYLKRVNKAISPVSLCPYIEHDGKDSTCPGLNDYLAWNPISFQVHAMGTYYNVDDIKNYLTKNKKPLGISTVIPLLRNYYPCDSVTSKTEKCGTCPYYLNFGADTTCYVKEAVPWNMDGEFIAHGEMSNEGGHAMVIAGFNDDYVTHDGKKGGLIIRNSWWAGVNPKHGPKEPRGDHSMGYFMQEHSDWDESTICPNSYNPSNWYSVDSYESAVSNDTITYATVLNQPLVLESMKNTTYYKDNTQVYLNTRALTENGLFVYCFIQHGGYNGSFCLDPMIESSVTNFVRPIREAVKNNDVDQCGYYFMSYDFITKVWGQYHQSFATSFDITWDDKSFLYNAADCAYCNYAFLKSSTFRQKHTTFDGPAPIPGTVEPFFK